MFDWDDLRIFLGVARSRTLAEAARQLELDATTVGRRLTRLGEGLGANLFEQAGGVRRLTESGHALFRHAEAVESAALSAMAQVTGESQSLAGQVRLSVAEGFGTWVLAPAMREFHHAHPRIRLDLITASGFLNPSKREADMAVMLARPQRGRLAVQLLGDYRLHLYASQSYLAAHGTPRRPADLRRHVLVGYIPELIYAPELDYLGEVLTGLEAVLRSTSINVQHQMISHGAGIGVLPDFIGDRDPGLVRILPDHVELTRDFWLVTHSDLANLSRVRAVAQWLRHRVQALQDQIRTG